ncbi:MAG: PEP-CTERM sorting domain-containing protein [Phycisphaerae bacterium]
MRSLLKGTLWATAALVAMSAATAYGTTYEVEARFKTVLKKQAVHLVKPAGNMYVYAGLYWFDKVSLSPDNQDNPAWWLESNFGGYCIDINQTINWDYEGTWQIQDLEDAPIGPGGDTSGAMGAARGELLKRLWGKYFESGPYPEFQVAVWELLVEDPANGYNVTNTDHDFYAPYNEVDRTTINTWLAEITADSYTGPVSDLMYAMTSSDTQDFAVLIETGGQMIPEPVTLAGLALGVGGLVGYIRKRKAGGA